MDVIIDEKNLNVEKVFEKIGGSSKFQLILLLLLNLELITSYVNIMPVLVGSTNVNFYCLDNSTSSLKLINKNDLCNSSCSGRVVPSPQSEHKTIVEEWSLICNKAWIVDSTTSIQMLGGTIGTLLVAYYSDLFGRKKSFMITSALLGLSGLITAQATDPYFYMGAKFFSGFTTGAAYVSQFTYLIEFFPISGRQIPTTFSMWSIGEMILALVGYLNNSWRVLERLTSVPAFLFLLGVFFLPESPRWLLTQNRTREAEKVFNKIAYWNSCIKISSEEILLVQTAVNAESLEKNKKFMALKSFTNLKLFLTLCLLCVIWFANTVIYWGITYNMKNIEGDPYWNVFYMGLADAAGNLVAYLAGIRFGRKQTFIANVLTSTLMLVPIVIIQTFYQTQFETAILVLCLLGKLFNEASWCVMACFTSESFPTVCRTFSLGICAVFAFAGSVFAPQLATDSLPKAFPYIVFAIFSLVISGI